jgi:hypothetical protein
MELQCKVFRGSDALELEGRVNRFLAEEVDRLGEIQFEEITQSEGEGGVTLVIWYSRVTAEHEERSHTASDPEELVEPWPEA